MNNPKSIPLRLPYKHWSYLKHLSIQREMPMNKMILEFIEQDMNRFVKKPETKMKKNVDSE